MDTATLSAWLADISQQLRALPKTTQELVAMVDKIAGVIKTQRDELEALDRQISAGRARLEELKTQTDEEQQRCTVAREQHQQLEASKGSIQKEINKIKETLQAAQMGIPVELLRTHGAG